MEKCIGVKKEIPKEGKQMPGNWQWENKEKEVKEVVKTTELPEPEGTFQ